MSATCFACAIVIRQLLAIEPLVTRLMKFGRRQRAPIVLPEDTYPAH
jgi:hypothetical protein